MHQRAARVAPGAGAEELLTLEEAGRRLALGRTTLYALMRAGELVGVKVGRVRRITARSVREYADRLAELAAAGGGLALAAVLVL